MAFSHPVIHSLRLEVKAINSPLLHSSWHPEGMVDSLPSSADARLFFPATLRNRDAIAAVLLEWLPSEGLVLEVASGSGEHAVFFQQQFPGLLWQSSDPDPAHLASIQAWMLYQGLADHMPEPMALDVLDEPWSIRRDTPVSAIIAINLIHIAPWRCCVALVTEAARLLPPDAPLVLYGPFRRGGVHCSDSNVAFDQSLRSRHPEWGVRDIEAVEALASDLGFTSMQIREMPANNLAVAFHR